MVTPISLEVLEKYQERINGITDCQELQDIMDELSAELQGKIDDALAMIEGLEIITKMPSIDSILDWVRGVIDLVIKPYTASIQAQILLLQKYAQLIQAIMDKGLTIQCSLTPPSLPEIPEIPLP